MYSLNGQETPSSVDSQTVGLCRTSNCVKPILACRRPSRFPRAQNALSLPFQTPATQANLFRIQLFFHVHRSLSPSNKTVLYMLKHISLLYSTTIKKSVLYSFTLRLQPCPLGSSHFQKKKPGRRDSCRHIVFWRKLRRTSRGVFERRTQPALHLGTSFTQIFGRIVSL